MDDEPETDVVESLVGNWPKLCHKTTEKDVRYGGYLAEAVPREYRQGVLEFVVPEEFEYHRQQLSGKAAKEVIKGVLWEVLGVRVNDLVFRSAPRTDPIFSRSPAQIVEEPASRDQVSPEELLEAEPAVKDLLEEFDGVILDVRNNPND